MDHAERYSMIMKEWRKFVNNVPVNYDFIISRTILDSWFRCRQNRVSPYMRQVPVVLSEEELTVVLDKNRELIDLCLPFMQHLYNLVMGSGFLVVLSDSNGYLLEIIGDPDVKESVKRGNFIVGACWSEEVAGTNGVGTVLKLGTPLQVFGCEHYCINSHKWTCSGAPIHDSENNLIGAIDMTGPYHKANPHTLGMVSAAAHAIENQIRLKKALTECQIADSFQRTVISSIPEMILTIDNNGTISMMNKNAKKMFGPDAENYLGRDIREIWGRQNENLLSLICSNNAVTDAEVRLSFRNAQGDYTLTCYPILSTNKTIGKIIIINEIKRARTLVTKMMGAKAKFYFEDIIGRNSGFQATLRQAQLASQSNSNVLLLGESGTGKDILAQAIHNGSSRKDGPYVAINCAAIPRDLITSELFGYSDGAFTGSRRGGSRGKFELAEGGTIFLDEIGETPLELQSALLRVIEDKSIIRIGGTKVLPVDVRIVTATNKNLKEQVRQGKFREDLYYRLNVFTIHLPPLRKRKDDIPVLVECFLKKISKVMGKQIDRIDDRVLEIFMNYHWPGNVRELQNVLERMVNIAHTHILTVDLLPFEIMDAQSKDDVDHGIESVDEIERRLLSRMINANLSKKEMAKKLGVSRSTLYRKLEQYELENSRPG
ncbi:MAG: sigma-54-dependent Fis family transcriptional regulator [Syntrophales bacterium]